VSTSAAAVLLHNPTGTKRPTFQELIMFDINAIITNAITQAVNEAIKPVQAQLEEAHIRIKTLEAQLQLNLPGMNERITALETGGQALNKEQLVDHLDQQEWFWDKLNDYIAREVGSHDLIDEDKVDRMIENAIEALELPDEDDIDEKISDKIQEVKDEIEDSLDEKINDKFDDYDIDHKLNRALSNASISITV
jgi:hypothetical protein